MDNQGMYQPHPCKQCGAKLNPNGHRPAELYAGTYTGLCYACQNKPGYVIARYKADGCQQWSYPPHRPSWRRDRESYKSYGDCDACAGAGHIYVSRSFARGGSYYVQCERCCDRFYSHPDRKAHSDEVDWAHREKIFPFKKKLDAKFQGLVPEELNGKYSSLTQDQRNHWAKLARPFLERFDAFRNPIIDEIYSRYASAYEKEIIDEVHPKED